MNELGIQIYRSVVPYMNTQWKGINYGLPFLFMSCLKNIHLIETECKEEEMAGICKFFSYSEWIW